MKKFRLLPVCIQWIIAIKLIVAMGFLFIVIGVLVFHKPLLFWLFLLYGPLFYFFTTPIFTLTGKYEYYSDVMFGYKSKKGIEVTLGTSFDYLFTVFPNWTKGHSVRTQIKRGFIEGSLTIIQHIETGKISNSDTLSTTSHLISKKTFEVFKVEQVKMSFLQKLDYYCYTLDILWMYIISCGVKKIYRIFDVKNVQIRAGEFCSCKYIFVKASEELESNTTSDFTISQYQKNYQS